MRRRSGKQEHATWIQGFEAEFRVRLGKCQCSSLRFVVDNRWQCSRNSSYFLEAPKCHGKRHHSRNWEFHRANSDEHSEMDNREGEFHSSGHDATGIDAWCVILLIFP